MSSLNERTLFIADSAFDYFIYTQIPVCEQRVFFLMNTHPLKYNYPTLPFDHNNDKMLFGLSNYNSIYNLVLVFIKSNDITSLRRRKKGFYNRFHMGVVRNYREFLLGNFFELEKSKNIFGSKKIVYILRKLD